MSFSPDLYESPKEQVLTNMSADNVNPGVIPELENENIQARDEELRSALEELQSSNEELQSTNEELETSKEELQSTNEELTTLNDELANRNTELTQLSSDIQNLFNSTRMPVIMVGRDLKIRRFTSLAKNVWNLIEADIGRALTDIRPNINIPNLKDMLIEAIDHLKTSNLEVKGEKGRWYSVTVLPYKTLENMIDGAVLTLNDITLLKKAQKSIEAAKEYFENIVTAVPRPMIVMDKHLLIRSANPAFYRDFKVSKNETEGKFIYELSDSQWNIPLLIKRLKKIISGDKNFDDLKLCHKFKKIGEKTMIISGSRIKENIAGENFILMVIEDATEKIKNEETIESLSRFPSENPNAVLRISKDKIIIYANAAAKKMLSADNISVGAKAPQLFSAIIDKIFTQGAMEMRYTNSGDAKVFFFSMIAVKDRDYINIYGKDITAQTKAEDEAKKLDEAKKNLVRDISHGIKTPIAMTEMAINIGKDAVKQKNFESVKHAQKLAQNNIKKVRKDVELILDSFTMDIKRLDISKKKKKKNVSLVNILKQTIKINKLMISEKSIKIKINLASGAFVFSLNFLIRSTETCILITLPF